MDKNKLIINKLIIIGSLLVAVFVIAFAWSAGSNNTSGLSESSETQDVSTVEIKDGIQYITVFARGGYSPRSISATSGLPTKLLVETKSTFDCSRAFTIPQLGINKMLPQSGTTEFDLGVPEKGDIQGLCSMGMYGFTMRFE